ncbi:MAG: EamA family transporter [Zoogloeaceae bacterium]|nr:EamA family transporter [Zoogloeaceae bacterium]
MKSKFGAGLAVMGAGLLWASAGAIGEGSTLPPLLLAELRLGIGGLALFVLLGRPQICRLVAQLGWKPLAIAVLGVGGFQWAFFAAVVQAGASFATWGSVATGPIWARAITGRLASEPNSAHSHNLTTVLGVAGGLGLLAIAQGISLQGVLLTLATGLAYALYATAANPASTTNRVGSDAGHTLTITAFALLCGALTLVPFAFPLIADIEFTTLGMADFARIVVLGLASTAFAYCLFAYGIRRLGAEKALSFQWVQPIATEFLGCSGTSALTSPAQAVGTMLLTAALLGQCARNPSMSHHHPAVDFPAKEQA